jgi:hypothetical protein
MADAGTVDSVCRNRWSDVMLPWQGEGVCRCLPDTPAVNTLVQCACYAFRVSVPSCSRNRDANRPVASERSRSAIRMPSSPYG